MDDKPKDGVYRLLVQREAQMIGVAEGISALKSLKSLYDIAKEVRESNDPEKLRIAAAQMFDLSLAAREQTAAL